MIIITLLKNEKKFVPKKRMREIYHNYLKSRAQQHMKESNHQ